MVTKKQKIVIYKLIKVIIICSDIFPFQTYPLSFLFIKYKLIKQINLHSEKEELVFFHIKFLIPLRKFS